MTTITFEAVKAVLEEIRDSVDADFKYDVEKPGNWTNMCGDETPYDPDFGCCAYRNRITNEPACIVGKALDTLGVLPEDTKFLEGSQSESVEVLLKGVAFDPRASTALSRAQNSQDEGETWHEAIDKALS